jgi:hypothetical protein
VATNNKKHSFEAGHWRWRNHTSPKVVYDNSGKIKSCSLGYDDDLGAALLLIHMKDVRIFQDTLKDEFLIEGDRCKIDLPLDNTFNGTRYIYKNNKTVRILYLPDSPK